MDDLVQQWGLWGLFISAFVSSTILPGGSEALLLALAIEGSYSPLSLLVVATAGNTLGGMSSWLIGRLLAWRFPAAHLKQEGQRRAVVRVRHWGSPVLLLSWLPLVGDPLCIAAGWLKVSPWLAALFIALGKLGRYGVLLWLV